MVVAATPYLRLFCQVIPGEQAHWHFILESQDGAMRIEASDNEVDLDGQRLELMALIRGLEAIEQPSRLSIVTTSDYVRRGLTNGLEEWRERSWCWERFGVLVPIKHADLWQRVDAALKFHQVTEPRIRRDGAHSTGRNRPRRPILFSQFQASEDRSESSDNTVSMAS